MPKVVFLYAKGLFGPEELERLGRKVRPLVADAANNAGTLTEKHVDWLPQELLPGSIMDAPVSFELETIGFPDRKKRLKAHTPHLKAALYELLPSDVKQKWAPTEPLLWVKYVDEDGDHA